MSSSLAAIEPTTPAQMFVSPNIETDMTFPMAKQALGSQRQGRLQQVNDVINQHLGINGTARPAIGAWADGAENSLHLSADHADPALFRAGAAMQAHLADQKAALVFREHPDGEHFLAHYDAPGHTLDQEHERLLKAGVNFHTLQETPHGVRGHVFGFGPDDLGPIADATKAINQRLRLVHGTGEFIGTTKEDGTDREQRDDARRAYEGIIQDAVALPGQRGRAAEQAWAHARDHWNQTQGANQAPLGPQMSDHIDPDHLLHWDEPIHQQHPYVQHRVGTIAAPAAVMDMTGGHLHNYLATRDPSRDAGAQQLLAAGIPGIRYHTDHRRVEHNHIVFDEPTMATMRRHGLPAMIHAGADALRDHKRGKR